MVISASVLASNVPFCGYIPNIFAAFTLVRFTSWGIVILSLFTPSLSNNGKSVPIPGNPASASHTLSPSSLSFS